MDGTVQRKTLPYVIASHSREGAEFEPFLPITCIPVIMAAMVASCAPNYVASVPRGPLMGRSISGVWMRLGPVQCALQGGHPDIAAMGGEPVDQFAVCRFGNLKIIAADTME